MPRAFDRNADGYTGHQVAHAGRRAGQDEVTGLKGHDGSDECDQLRDGEEHIAGGGHLPEFITDMAGD